VGAFHDSFIKGEEFIFLREFYNHNSPHPPSSENANTLAKIVNYLYNQFCKSVDYNNGKSNCQK
jgi:hypothetical protein